MYKKCCYIDFRNLQMLRFACLGDVNLRFLKYSLRFSCVVSPVCGHLPVTINNIQQPSETIINLKVLSVTSKIYQQPPSEKFTNL
jgi:hypothetical protein